jgi:4-aminobutyrate aminotransferase
MEKDHLKAVYGKYFAPSLQKATELVVDRGEGAYLYTTDGQRYLDLVQGIAVNSLGHCHPSLVEAVCDQVKHLCHASFNLVNYPSTLELAIQLQRITPGHLDMFFFINTGAEAVESALKLARYVSRKSTMIAFRGSFHGRTMGATSVTSSKASFRKRYAPFLPQVHFAPYPYCYRCPFGCRVENCQVECLQYLKEDFEYIVPAEDIAAVIFEPILGEGGYIVPPQKYLDSLAQLCKDIGCLLIFDEVQSGMGRTGKMFAFENFGVTPDILCIGKSIGGGFPMAVIASTEEIMRQWESGAHGTTFGGHPVAAAAALAQLEILTRDGFLKDVSAKGDRFKTKLSKLQRSCPQLGDVRGIGLMIAIEFVGEAGEPNPKKAAEIRARLFSENILVLPCGLKGQAIRFIPPLNIDENLLDNVVNVLAKALA